MFWCTLLVKIIIWFLSLRSFIHSTFIVLFVCILSVWLVLYRLIALLFIFHIEHWMPNTEHSYARVLKPEKSQPNLWHGFRSIQFIYLFILLYSSSDKFASSNASIQKKKQNKNNNKRPEIEPKPFFFCSFFSLHIILHSSLDVHIWWFFILFFF